MNFEDLISPAHSRQTAQLPANIYLTGFMGAGKTSVGKLLAIELGIDYYDTDEIIIAASGMSIGEIFKTRGERFFRDTETGLLKLLGEKPLGTCIISTGGGAILREENRTAMRQNGLIIFLDVSAEEAYRRVSKSKDRPLLNTTNPLDTIKDLLEKRRPFYQKADLIVQTSGLSISETAKIIIDAVKGWNNEGKEEITGAPRS